MIQLLAALLSLWVLIHLMKTFPTFKKFVIGLSIAIVAFFAYHMAINAWEDYQEEQMTIQAKQSQLKPWELYQDVKH